MVLRCGNGGINENLIPVLMELLIILRESLFVKSFLMISNYSCNLEKYVSGRPGCLLQPWGSKKFSLKNGI